MALQGVWVLTFSLVPILLLNSQDQGEAATQSHRVPILLYHRFGPTVADSMTVRTTTFASQLQYLQDHGYTVIPLSQLVAYRLGKAPPPTPRSVAITADDGHRSVYTDMFPLVKRYKIPVTLFIYPSAISNTTYALTWEQLREMWATGLFDIQSHTFWHPNFRVENKRMAPSEYSKFVEMQLTKSKEALESHLGIKVDMVAWPFGIYDNDLLRQATAAGYIAGFSMERRVESETDNIMALPRFLMMDEDRGQRFERLLDGK